eukprot:TRINITY_DN2021_c0_g1_i5.p1 TRINITY_DN2021_c0_g1~~TRINITY_DN2021_c0_g1_i5.p1  ORF type:complete len:127 (-),score=12.24 TRINITY_DN2021_c0_g1_i5:137-517(-)
MDVIHLSHYHNQNILQKSLDEWLALRYNRAKKERNESFHMFQSHACIKNVANLRLGHTETLHHPIKAKHRKKSGEVNNTGGLRNCNLITIAFYRSEHSLCNLKNEIELLKKMLIHKIVSKMKNDGP